MDRLWAPWRLSYVTAAQVPPTTCIFCDPSAGRDLDLVVLRGERCYVIRGGSTLIGFIAGSESPATGGFRMIGAHTDSPNLRVKPDCRRAM